MIKYVNGTKEIITTTKTEKKLSKGEMYAKGQSDAKLLYKGNGPMSATLVSTLLYPPYGLIEGVISGAIPPKEKNLKVPDVNLMLDQNYAAGYKKQAHKKKVKKVITGFGIGITPWIIGLFILSASDN